MANPSNLDKATICLLLLLSIVVGLASSARILDEVDPQPQLLPTPTGTTLPSGQTPAVAPTATDDEDNVDPPIPATEAPATLATPVDEVAAPVDEVAAPVVPPATIAGTTTSVAPANPGPDEVTAPPAADEAPVSPPIAVAAPVTGAGTTATSANPGPHEVAAPPAADEAPVAPPIAVAAPVTGAGTTATSANPGPHEPHLTFFMHDILGGSHPSARVVTGIIASSEINGIPFSKPNNNLFPLTGGTPLLNSDSLDSLINPNNLPFVVGLNSQQGSTSIQTTGSRDNIVNSNNQPFVTAGNLPAGSTLQALLFGSITVIDDQLTEGHELGSAVIGKMQGFYMASSLDGTSQTIALTALFHYDHEHEHEHDLEDTISFFGVHRMASLGSQIVIVGGTGKYENARGYATVATLHHEDQHTTDGVDTILEFSVYLTE